MQTSENNQGFEVNYIGDYGINNGGVINFTTVDRSTDKLLTTGQGRIKVGKENSTEFDGSSYMSFFTKKDDEPDQDERVRITSLGDVGIGTTNPNKKLQIVGQTQIGESNDAGVGELAIRSSSSNHLNFTRSGVASWITGVDSNASYIIKDNNSEKLIRFIIESNGDVGIGTNNPKAKLDVRDGDIYIDKNGLKNTNTDIKYSKNTYIDTTAGSKLNSSVGNLYTPGLVKLPNNDLLVAGFRHDDGSYSNNTDVWRSSDKGYT
jgi:hypothetical protein